MDGLTNGLGTGQCFGGQGGVKQCDQSGRVEGRNEQLGLGQANALEGGEE